MPKGFCITILGYRFLFTLESHTNSPCEGRWMGDRLQSKLESESVDGAPKMSSNSEL